MPNNSRNQHDNANEQDASIRLPAEIDLVLSLGHAVAPIGCLGRPVIFPTTDANELEAAFREYPDCCWAVELSSIAILEYLPSAGKGSLSYLCNHDWDYWPETLQYQWGPSLYLLFRRDGEEPLQLGERFPGLRLHTRGLMPIPPSVFGVDTKLRFVNKEASIQGLPQWLRSEAQHGWFPDAA